MASSSTNKISKFLSFVLRHKPEAIGLTLNEQSWANIDELISKANASGEIKSLDRPLIQNIVYTSDKKRFIISDDGQNIRANQGHSTAIILHYQLGEEGSQSSLDKDKIKLKVTFYCKSSNI